LSIQQQNRCACVNERLFLGDRERIKQIIMNLVANAVKFTESGTITLSVDCVHTDEEDIEELRFYISDTGIGIPSDKLASIFGKFEQADTSITRRFGGTGLGLAFAKSLAEAMGGTISAESELGIGSTFVVRLPLRRAHPTSTAAAAAAKSAKPRTERSSILLVEDNPGNVLVATHLLDEFGYSFDVAGDGLEAVELIKAGTKYDAILMDIQMPRLDGCEATKAIREFESATAADRTPIIATTAHTLMHDRVTCIEAGMDDYIAKPIDAERLRTILADVIRGSTNGVEGTPVEKV
jgi:CheY-like chemotaxis protein